jgi:DNA-binding NarL/FixJ family response regulator
MIRVMLVEDHAVVRAGLEELLAGADDIEVAGVAGDGAEAVTLAQELKPDVILMDLSMPELDGIEATRRIVSDNDGVRIVILTSFSDRERILEALDAGAIGYLLKDADPDELFRGIRAAAAGESPLAPKAATTVLADRSPDPVIGELTEREREVLALVAEGEPNKLIARRLEISEATVKAHLTSVFRRLGVTSRTEAAIWARDHGIAGPSA